jgi:hypothetical protein
MWYTGVVISLFTLLVVIDFERHFSIGVQNYKIKIEIYKHKPTKLHLLTKKLSTTLLTTL